MSARYLSGHLWIGSGYHGREFRGIADGSSGYRGRPHRGIADEMCCFHLEHQ